MQTRQDIESRIAELRRDRGAAVLGGKKYESAKIDQLENQLKAIDDAEAEAVRRQRDQAAKDAAAARKQKLKSIEKLEADRLLAWSDAEAATRDLLKAIGRVVEATDSERNLWADLGAVPTALSPFDTQGRIRGRVGELLTTTKAGFKFPGQGGLYLRAVTEEWKEAERKPIAAQIRSLEETK